MSFDHYESKSIAYRVKAQSKHWRPSNVPNLLYRSTIGLAELYPAIDLKEKLPKLLVPERLYTNENGFFDTKSDILLHQRYKIMEVIGQGASSIVYKAEDIITQRVVAIKSVRSNYDILASREKIIIDYIQYSERCSQELPVISSLGWFFAKGHIFIVLPYYSHSLLEFISLGRNESVAVHSASSEMKLNHSPLVLLQPKPIANNRPIFNASSAFNSPYYLENLPLHLKVSLPSTTNTPSLADNIFNDYDLLNFQKIAFQLLTATYVLHKEGIIHADMKPENCFLHFPQNIPNFSSSSSANIANADPFFLLKKRGNGPFATNASAISSFRWLRQLPSMFQLKVADFSNAIHISEIPSYFQEFNIQSAPYRAPEVLIGIPFHTGIDLWSIGIILLELCLRKAFITTNDPQEIIQLIESKIGKFSKLRFSGGKHAHLLFEKKFPHFETNTTAISNTPSKGLPGNDTLASPSSGRISIATTTRGMLRKENHEMTNYRLENMKAIKRLLLKSVQFEISNHHLHAIVDLIGQLLVIDPTQRISAREALQHSFFAALYPLPYQLLVPFHSSEGQDSKKEETSPK